MRLDSEGLRAIYRQETSRARRAAGDCLSEDLLARAAAGELDQAARESTADHLAICSDCAKEYRAIKSLKPWADEVSSRAGSIATNVRSYPFAVAPPQTRARTFSFYFPYAVAAASLLFCLALGAIIISKSRENQRLMAQANQQQVDSKTAEALAESRRLLEETNRRVEEERAARRLAEAELAKRDAAAKSNPGSTPVESSGSNVNVPIIDLNPQDAGRGDQNLKAAEIQLDQNTDLFTLILNLRGEDSSSAYSLVVTDRNNRTVWTAGNLRKSPYNNFTVAMRHRSFPAGEYRLKIFGLRDGRRELIEEYAIRLAYR